jgi:hypothetical protein
VAASDIPTVVDQLARFKVRLMKNGELMEEGSGKNSLRSPALCLGNSRRPSFGRRMQNRSALASSSAPGR